MMNLVKVIMVVLGCHISEIQENRISTSISLVSELVSAIILLLKNKLMFQQSLLKTL